MYPHQSLAHNKCLTSVCEVSILMKGRRDVRVKASGFMSTKITSKGENRLSLGLLLTY